MGYSLDEIKDFQTKESDYEGREYWIGKKQYYFVKIVVAPLATTENNEGELEHQVTAKVANKAGTKYRSVDISKVFSTFEKEDKEKASKANNQETQEGQE